MIYNDDSYCTLLIILWIIFDKNSIGKGCPAHTEHRLPFLDQWARICGYITFFCDPVSSGTPDRRLPS